MARSIQASRPQREHDIRQLGESWFERVPASLLRIIRKRVVTALRNIQWGHVHLSDPLGVEELGNRRHGPSVRVQVQSLQFYAYVGLGGSTGAGQGYFLGLWDTDNLVDVIRILVRNEDSLRRLDRGLARISAPAWAWFHRRRSNSRTGSRQNISAHYDLGNDFFTLMLDRTLMYSAGIYPSDEADLEAAQIHRLEIICEKLQLHPESHLLEIGTGWGALAIHAARTRGCRVTTTTISREQYDHAVARVAAAGLSDRITVLFEDYRDLKGSFDRLVSIEMIEAVGDAYLPEYFRVIDRLLDVDGLALIQAITIEDRRYEQYRKSVDFIRRFVFPGGCLPSIGVMIDCIRRATSMRVRHLEEIGDHYARTLADWQRRIDTNRQAILALGYDETFLRLWRFYLAYCQGGFLERSIGNVQLLFEKPASRAPSPVSRIDMKETAQCWI